MNNDALEIGGKSKAKLSVDDVLSLPITPYGPLQDIDHKNTVVVLQRENALVQDASIKNIAIVHCTSCLFVVFKGKTREGVASCLASHVDTYSAYDWDLYLNDLQHHPIEVILMGGDWKKESRETLRNILQYLLELANNNKNFTFVFKHQRLLDNFSSEQSDRTYLCTSYVLERVEAMYLHFFKKTFPPYFLDFAEKFPLDTYKSPVPGLEKAIEKIRLKQGEVTHEEWSVLFSKLSSSAKQCYLFACVLIMFNSDEPPARKIFDTNSSEYLKYFASADEFEKHVKRLFSAEGYDALRLALSQGEGFVMQNRVTDFVLNLENNTVSPLPCKVVMSQPFRVVRLAKVFESAMSPVLGGREYFECFRSPLGYQRPTITAGFLAVFDVIHQRDRRELCSKGIIQRFFSEIFCALSTRISSTGVKYESRNKRSAIQKQRRE